MSHNFATNWLTVNLVRHAQSTNNALEKSLRGKYVTLEEFWLHYEEQRSNDPALSDEGRGQAEALAAHLATVKISQPLRLFCSPLQRSIDTAKTISEAIGAQPELWVDIFEEGGYYLTNDPSVRSGKTRAEIEALGVGIPSDFKEGVIAKVTDHGWWNHERETTEESVARARAVLKKLQELSVQYAGQKMTLWLVAHGDFLSTLLCVLLRRSVVGDHKALYFYHDNCGVTQFSINPKGEIKVSFINRHITPFAEAITDSPSHTAPPIRSVIPL
eukprot:Phypoly_transcript_14239.p1 GENE.Phypoly_transcript_14239~~Phypoly_transcript_14239.p1  ORF type:complete len:273 (+),score=30.73 Phypoly_transcript_14239:171-989(+)